MPVPAAIQIGLAGWGIPTQHAATFPGAGTHLQRYASVFGAVEINSSFYRPHRPATYARWAGGVTPGFRFAVKMPREITHHRKLVEVVDPMEQFLAEVRSLGDRLGALLVQLPPSLSYDASVAETFFAALRNRFTGAVVCEPRHATWFTDPVDEALSQFQVARVAADPALVPRAAVPGGWPNIVYRRLHGSPRMYHSSYSVEHLEIVAQAMQQEAAQGRESWCIFDNTALGEATQDGLWLSTRLAHDTTAQHRRRRVREI